MISARVRKFYNIAVIVILLSVTTLAVRNWDVAIRFSHYHRDGSLTLARIRSDIASFNIGRRSQVQPIDTKTSMMDGMLQLYVPEGEFLMGTNEEHTSANSPRHMVYLDGYWMDQIEVTNAMYLNCMEANGCTRPASDNIQYDNWVYRDHPITYVTWFQADEYCRWAGRRLPTEAEWEKAARGTDGRRYPWGNTRPNARLSNFADANIHEAVSAYRYPLGASPYGVLNMSGNVREWVMDWFDPLYYTYSPYDNPQGPATGEERSLRSGSYNEDQKETRAFSRFKHEPQSAGLSRGFRCAQDAEIAK